MIDRVIEAFELYGKMIDLVNAQQAWSEKQFGPARERDAREPIAHLKKECGELYDLIEQWNAGNLPPERAGEIDKEIADLLILFLDVLWRTGRKFGAAVDAATAKMKENVKREWPAHTEWLFDLENTKRGGVWEWTAFAKRCDDTVPNNLIAGYGDTSYAATEDAYRKIRDLNAHCVEHVRDDPPTEEEMTRLAAEELAVTRVREVPETEWAKEVVPPVVKIDRTGAPKRLKDLTPGKLVAEWLRDAYVPVKVDNERRAELAFFVGGVEHKVVSTQPDQSGRVRIDLEPVEHARGTHEKIPLVFAPDSEHYKCPTCEMECLIGIVSAGPNRAIPMCPTCKVDMEPVKENPR